MTTPDDRTPYTPGQPSPYATGDYIPPTSPSFSLAGTPAPAPKKSPRPRIIVAVVGLIALIAVIGATVAITLSAQHGTSPAATKASGQSAWDKEQQAAAATTPDPAPAAAATPAVSDLKLTLKTTDKQCFGSAGCNLTVKVNLGYGGPTLSTDDTWLVTYEISGVDDGPLIGSFELTGDEYTVNEESVSTKSSKTKVTVKVTSVEKVGL